MASESISRARVEDFGDPDPRWIHKSGVEQQDLNRRAHVPDWKNTST